MTVRTVPEQYESPNAEYTAYLQSDHWRNVRNSVLFLAGYRCAACAAQGDLHVHHTNYDHLGDEGPDDLRVLCGDCHQRWHRENWMRNKRGNWWKMFDEDRVTVFKTKNWSWKFVVDDTFSESFRSADEAMCNADSLLA